MGQKVHPLGFRLGITYPYISNWYVPNKKLYKQMLMEDIQLRNFLCKRLAHGFVSKIYIERLHGDNALVTINIYSGRPGIIIGKNKEEIINLKKACSKYVNGTDIRLNVKEVESPMLDATLIAANICNQIEKRVHYRKVMKKAIYNTMNNGAEGVKIKISGRLNGVEIARNSWLKEGKMPLHTLRADIDYKVKEAFTTYGVIGVKVWVYKGEKLNPKVISK